MTDRFELRNGKFGAYFFDTKSNEDALPLEEVLDYLNFMDELAEDLLEAQRFAGERY